MVLSEDDLKEVVKKQNYFEKKNLILSYMNGFLLLPLSI